MTKIWTEGPTATATEVLPELYGTSLTDDLVAAATAVTAGDFRQATALADRLYTRGRQIQVSVVRDALTAGVDWWTLGELLAMHPQAVFDAYAPLVEGLPSPAQQRPNLAVVCTAGLVSVHDMELGYGFELEDFGPDYSLVLDPTVRRLVAAAELLGDQMWIVVTLPDEVDAAEDLGDDRVVIRWTTVVRDLDEVARVREALLSAVDPDFDDDGFDDDLEPL